MNRKESDKDQQNSSVDLQSALSHSKGRRVQAQGSITILRGTSLPPAGAEGNSRANTGIVPIHCPRVRTSQGYVSEGYLCRPWGWSGYFHSWLGLYCHEIKQCQLINTFWPISIRNLPVLWCDGVLLYLTLYPSIHLPYTLTKGTYWSRSL